jgi:hypothetical protein
MPEGHELPPPHYTHCASAHGLGVTLHQPPFCLSGLGGGKGDHKPVPQSITPGPVLFVRVCDYRAKYVLLT